MEVVVSKVFLITGAGRGMGVDFARAALAAGHSVVATGHRPEAVAAAIGADEDLLAVKLDVTEPADAQAAVAAAVERFGRIDVLVDNAGNFQVGFFEEISPEQFRAQQEVNLFGPVDVTRAVLPVMRRQRSGMVVTISSAAGLVGNEGGSAYVTSKFALEGFMESLAGDVAPYGIRTMIVEPGFFRTELLGPASTIWPALSIEDHAERNAAMRPFWDSMNGTQAGDPAKLATALIGLIDSPEPPARWVAGTDVLLAAEPRARTLLAQAEAHRELSSSLAHDDAATPASA
jgi:NAD(P)-dependent dehydrogenase (short-subunit alcohol dehydrogenase family)